MPIRFIARYLLNHPELIDRLSNSYIMRRAAQLTASAYFRAKGLSSETIGGIWKDLERLMARRMTQSNDGMTKPGFAQKGANDQSIEDQLQKLKRYADELKRRQIK